ncbi:MFS transporter [Actinoplanes sp. DH11]|uniref:MFS transporter n=1 Tax=Actinoplanes sp. DH11 TaxID=2857011 RepID=UPI001E496B14|nr:MFS transporter [Actinoplanes sp. DH11]
MLASELTTAFGIGLTQPYLIVLLHSHRGIALALATGVVSLAAITSLLGNPLAGVLIDRFGGRTVMVLGLMIAAAGMLLLAATPGLFAAAAGVAVTGLGWSISIPALATRLAVLTPPDRHQRVYTLQFVMFNIGMAAGAGLGALFLGPRMPVLWLAAALFCLISIGLVLITGRSATAPVPVEGRTAGGYREALRDRYLLLLLGAAALLSTVGYGLFNAAPSLLAIAAGDPAALSWLSVANCVTIIAGAPIAWRLTARLPARTALLATAGLWALAWAVCIPEALPIRAELTCAAVLVGAGELLLAGALPTLVNAIAPDDLRGRYNALSSLSLTTGMAVGPLLTSATAASGRITPILYGAVALAAVAAFLLCYARPGEAPVDAQP